MVIIWKKWTELWQLFSLTPFFFCFSVIICTIQLWEVSFIWLEPILFKQTTPKHFIYIYDRIEQNAKLRGFFTAIIWRKTLTETFKTLFCFTVIHQKYVPELSELGSVPYLLQLFCCGDTQYIWFKTVCLVCKQWVYLKLLLLLTLVGSANCPEDHLF